MRLASADASYPGGSGGMLPRKVIEHSETPETKNLFPRQGWSSLKFSLKSKIFNENGQLVGEGEGGMATT